MFKEKNQDGKWKHSQEEIKCFLFFLSLLFNFIVFLIPHQTFINANFLISKAHSCDPEVLLRKCFS